MCVSLIARKLLQPTGSFGKEPYPTRRLGHEGILHQQPVRSDSHSPSQNQRNLRPRAAYTTRTRDPRHRPVPPHPPLTQNRRRGRTIGLARTAPPGSVLSPYGAHSHRHSANSSAGASRPASRLRCQGPRMAVDWRKNAILDSKYVPNHQAQPRPRHLPGRTPLERASNEGPDTPRTIGEPWTTPQGQSSA